MLCVSEKSKPHRHSPVQCLSAWRASSADPVVPYLAGHWPKDINSFHHYHSGGVFMCDKSTQVSGPVKYFILSCSFLSQSLPPLSLSVSATFVSQSLPPLSLSLPVSVSLSSLSHCHANSFVREFSDV